MCVIFFSKYIYEDLQKKITQTVKNKNVIKHSTYIILISESCKLNFLFHTIIV